MAEQRLIDANELQKEFEWLESAVCSCRKDDVADSLQRVKNAQTIDPETLPIVQKLREELEMVTTEKYKAVETIFKYAGCQECKWWNDKDGFCEKQGRNAVLCDWLCSPVWRGAKEG